MKKFFFLCVLAFSSLNMFAAELGAGYTKVTDLSTLKAGDKVVLYCDAASEGVTGWNGTKDATISTTASDWVKYIVEVDADGVYLKDTYAEKYITTPGSSNQFKYGDKAACALNAADNALGCGGERYLYKNVNGDKVYYRMYVDKSKSDAYSPFYAYVVAPVEEVAATAIELNKVELTLDLYHAEKLIATLTPAEATTEIEWTTSDATVATVSRGVVTALKEGTATITAKAGEGVEATCAVTVNAAPATWTCEYLAGVAVEIPEAITFEGYVTGIYQEWDDEHKNISFYLADEKDGGEVFLCFRAKPADGERKVVVGDKVSITGKVGMYNGKSQLLQGCEYSVTTPSAIENINANEVKATKIVENGQIFIIKNGVKYNIFGAEVR